MSVLSYVVSSRTGMINEIAAFNQEVAVELEDVQVFEGDIFDVVIAPGPTDSYDGYSWSQTIRLTRPEGAVGQSVRTEWSFRNDFHGPPSDPPEPLSLWGQLAQVLLLTNEFLYVD